jgi:hypothetical protein
LAAVDSDDGPPRISAQGDKQPFVAQPANAQPIRSVLRIWVGCCTL